METTFLEKLLTFYKEDPEDPFNLYVLALEYQKFDANQADFFFKALLSNHPQYLPTYYHAAQFFSVSDQDNMAESTFIKGIELATIQQNSKTQQELTRAYRTFVEEKADW